MIGEGYVSGQLTHTAMTGISLVTEIFCAAIMMIFIQTGALIKLYPPTEQTDMNFLM